MIKSRRIRWAGNVVRVCYIISTYTILIGNPEGKRLIGRPKHRWDDNIKINLRKIRLEGVDLSNLAKDMEQWLDFVNFSILCVQTGSGAHPASCPMGTGGPFPGYKARPGSDADHSTHLVPRSGMSRSYISSPPKHLHGV
jgi:hypothetical protein